MKKAIVSFGMLLSGMIGLTCIFSCGAFGAAPANFDILSLAFFLLALVLVGVGLISGLFILNSKD